MWWPAKFIINNNAKVPVLTNLFSMTVFETKIKVLMNLFSMTVFETKIKVLMNLCNMTVFETKIKAKLMLLPSSRQHFYLFYIFFLQDVKSWRYCRTSQMLYLYFSVVPFEQCLYFYQMHLVKYHP